MPKPGPRSSSSHSQRRRWTPDDAKEALDAHAASGLSLAAFAIREGLDPQRLTRWRRRLAPSVDVPIFEEVPRPEPAVAPSGEPENVATHHQRFEIVTATGRVVRVPEAFDAGTLRRILAIVDEVRPC
jgi:hypothetical protein